MSPLSDSLDDYLHLRRSLGYKLDRTSQVLAGFVTYSDAAVSWALCTPNPDSSWRAGRPGAVRCFARYLHALDPVHEVPPLGLIPRSRGRPAPRLFTKDQVVALMSAARQLRSPIQAATIETVVGLLWATGLRVGEAIRLDTTDLDVSDSLLMVRNSKNGRSRTIPIDGTTADALCSYVDTRNRLFESRSEDSLFVSTVGRRLRSGNLGTAFASVVDMADLPRTTGAASVWGAFVTVLPCRAFSSGTMPVLMSEPSCRGCRPIWATSVRPRHIGTCRPRPNYFRRRPGVWCRRHSNHPLGTHHGIVLHRSPGGTAKREPQHRGRLSTRFASCSALSRKPKV